MKKAGGAIEEKHNNGILGNGCLTNA